MEKMKKKFNGMVVVIIGIGLLFGGIIAGAAKEASADELMKRNVMYYGDWSIKESQGYFYPKDIPADKLTHLNFAFLDFDVEGNLEWTDEFAALKTPAGEPTVIEGSASAGLLNALQELRLKNSNLKIGVSVGGWTKSGDFALNAQNEVYRKKLVENLVKFIAYNEMDFLDIDWEYPGSVRDPDLVDSSEDEGTKAASEADRANFVLLLKELRVELDKLGTKTGKAYELSVALAAGPYTLNQGTDIAGIFEVVDFANIMTYDIHGAWENTTNHHSGLYTSPNAPQGNGQPWSFSINDSVNFFLANGAKAENLVIGAAFYSRGWENVENDGPDPENAPGLFGSTDFVTLDADGNKSRGAINELPIVNGDGGRNGGIWSYRNFKQLKEKYPDLKEYWDDDSKAPYMYGKESKVFFTYDNERSLKEKAKYIHDKGLGGMITWMQSQDAPIVEGSNRREVLTNAIYEGLYGASVLQTKSIETQDLRVSGTVEPLTDGTEGYQVAIVSGEELIETDPVLASLEAKHKSWKKPMIYIPLLADEVLRVGEYILPRIEIAGERYYQLDLTKIGYETIDPTEIIRFTLLTDANFAHLNRIPAMTMTQRIATEEYGKQTIFELENGPVVMGEMTYNFVNEEGEKIKDSVVKNGEIGSELAYDAPAIEGYTIEATNYTGVYKYSAQKHDFIYSKNQLGKVSVTYQDTNGNPLRAPIEFDDEIGASYETEVLKFSGYELIEIPKNATGIVGQDTIEVKYVYKAVEDKSVVTNGTNFPQTGENHNTTLIILGIVALLLFGIIRVKNKQKITN